MWMEVSLNDATWNRLIQSVYIKGKKKGKAVPCAIRTRRERRMGDVEVALHIFLNYGTKWGGVVSPTLDRLYLPKVPGNTMDTPVLNLIGGWMHLRALWGAPGMGTLWEKSPVSWPLFEPGPPDS